MRDGWYELDRGDRVAGYEITRPIGRGGSASVYEARRDGRAVALKIMHAHDPTGTGRLRFEREVALVKKLRHPHVVELLDHGHTEDGVPFLALSLVAGQPLKSLLRTGLEPARVARIADQILDAMAAAHAMGIVHRDIKPTNVMIEKGDRAMVLDFGLAKALFGDLDEVETITETGHRLGTPRYMSPEMARGQPAGPPGDVYALGLVIAEMVSGSPVITTNVQVDVLMAHASSEPLVLDEAVRRSPFGPLLARALSKDPSRRPTAAAMRQAIGEALAVHARAISLFGADPPRAEATAIMGGDPWAETLPMQRPLGLVPEPPPAPDEPTPRRFPVAVAVMGAIAAGLALALAWIMS